MDIIFAPSASCRRSLDYADPGSSLISSATLLWLPAVFTPGAHPVSAASRCFSANCWACSSTAATVVAWQLISSTAVTASDISPVTPRRSRLARRPTRLCGRCSYCRTHPGCKCRKIDRIALPLPSSGPRASRRSRAQTCTPERHGNSSFCPHRLFPWSGSPGCRA